MALYLIHLDEPYCHSQHYLGFVEDLHGLEDRLFRHRTGQGSRLLAAATKAGIAWKVVRVWEDGDRNAERRKKNHSHKERCPLCKAEAYARNRDKMREYNRQYRARKRSGAQVVLPAQAGPTREEKKRVVQIRKVFLLAIWFRVMMREKRARRLPGNARCA